MTDARIDGDTVLDVEGISLGIRGRGIWRQNIEVVTRRWAQWGATA
jgi:hypothetical protein